MKPYNDFDSGIMGYEDGNDYIRVWFKSGHDYLYSYSNVGVQIVEEMKRLARQGDGLNAYINRNVRN